MKKGRRPRRRPRLKLSDKAGPDQCPVPGENALFPAQIAGFLAVSRAVPVYPVFLNYVVPVQYCTEHRGLAKSHDPSRDYSWIFHFYQQQSARSKRNDFLLLLLAFFLKAHHA